MTNAAIAADVHQALDVHLHLAPQGAFDLVIRCDRSADLCYFIIGQVGDFLVEINPCLGQDRACGCWPDTVNVC